MVPQLVLDLPSGVIGLLDRLAANNDHTCPERLCFHDGTIDVLHQNGHLARIAASIHFMREVNHVDHPSVAKHHAGAACAELGHLGVPNIRDDVTN